MKNNIYNKFKEKKGQIAVLIDPEKSNDENKLKEIIQKTEFAGIDYLFIGGSTVSKKDFDFTIDYLSKHSKLPLVIFPGAHHQISEKADGLLYLSLLSGRNPDFLIGHHVQSANELIKMDLEIIPTGYILIDGGNLSTVAYISQTTPIPRDQTNIIKSTAIAGVLQGKKLLFFDAGSGASHSIPAEILNELTFLNVPLIVGGGVKSINDIKKYREAGVNVIVIGNHIEENIDFLIDLKEYIYEKKHFS